MHLIPDFDLRSHNTFGLAARARYGALIQRKEDIPALVAAAEASGLPLRILGEGSNVVLRPYFDGVLGLMVIKGRTIVSETDQETVVEAGAGENWHDFVVHTVTTGLPGLENLAGIPGTVGAAPVQNIGAYGLELADRFASLTAYDLIDKQFVELNRQACAFSYRQSVFKRPPQRYIVAAVRMALPRRWQPTLGYAGLSDLPATADAATVMDRVVHLRRSKLPDWTKTGNAGSFFHNPVVDQDVAERIRLRYPDAPGYVQPDGRIKLSAGWLIEKSGFKGRTLGSAGVSDQHALVLINHGGATQPEIAALSAAITSGVYETFGVSLVQEPETL